MNIKNDHFYLAVDEISFKELLKNERLMNLSFHKEVVADEGQASWEGLYFIGEDKIYFELVKENEKMGIRPGSIGLALSHLAEKGEQESLEKIIKTMTDITWTESERKKEDGSSWFKSWFNEKYEPGFVFWLMAYQGKEIEGRGNKTPTGIKRFIEARFHLPVENFSYSIDILSQIVDTSKVGEILEVSFPDQRMNLKLSPNQSQNELDIETLDGKLVTLTF